VFRQGTDAGNAQEIFQLIEQTFLMLLYEFVGVGMI